MLRVYGASDDLIEVEGDISEEFSATDDINYVACSDGTVLKLYYDGDWYVKVVQDGTSPVKVRQAEGDEPDYSQVAEVNGDINWVAHAIGFASAE